MTVSLDMVKDKKKKQDKSTQTYAYTYSYKNWPDGYYACARLCCRPTPQSSASSRLAAASRLKPLVSG